MNPLFFQTDEKSQLYQSCKPDEYMPIYVEQTKIKQFWEDLSIIERESILHLYDLQVIDEIVQTLKTTLIFSQLIPFNFVHYVQKEDQNIHITDGLIFEQTWLPKYQKDIIKQFVIYENYLNQNAIQNQTFDQSYDDVIEVSDWEIIRNKRKQIKVKLSSIMTIFQTLCNCFQNFCSGNKKIIQKKLYNKIFIAQYQTKQLQINEILIDYFCLFLENNILDAYFQSQEVQIKFRNLNNLLINFNDDNEQSSSEDSSLQEDISEKSFKSSDEEDDNILDALQPKQAQKIKNKKHKRQMHEMSVNQETKIGQNEIIMDGKVYKFKLTLLKSEQPQQNKSQKPYHKNYDKQVYQNPKNNQEKQLYKPQFYRNNMNLNQKDPKYDVVHKHYYNSKPTNITRKEFYNEKKIEQNYERKQTQVQSLYKPKNSIEFQNIQ